ncbi:hypothetical protein KR032_012159 [Drosophila birchii]|nr:hypothetical protein KR032_012159 [Drosophila birchii]
MATMDDFFNKIKRKYPSIYDDLRAIFKNGQNDSPQRSMTLSQIRGKYSFGLLHSENVSLIICNYLFFAAAYSQRTGEDFPVKGGTRTQMCFILTIPYVACFTSQIGTLRFFTIEAN